MTMKAKSSKWIATDKGREVIKKLEKPLGKSSKCMFLKGDFCNSDYGKQIKCNGICVPEKCPYPVSLIGKCFEAYEQGKKEARKQTLEEVLKDVHRRFELAKKYHNRRALSDMGFEALEREHGYQTVWLEQKIKAME